MKLFYANLSKIVTLLAISQYVHAQSNFILTGPASEGPGINNTHIGLQAGNNTTSATNNTFVGRQAGYTNTTAGANTFIGDAAGYSNTLGARVRSLAIGPVLKTLPVIKIHLLGQMRDQIIHRVTSIHL